MRESRPMALGPTETGQGDMLKKALPRTNGVIILPPLCFNTGAADSNIPFDCLFSLLELYSSPNLPYSIQLSATDQKLLKTLF